MPRAGYKPKPDSRPDSYGDPNFKGNGYILCGVCGGKLNKHPLRPCEMLAERIIKAQARADKKVATPITPG